jgi:hypothetical protein
MMNNEFYMTNIFEPPHKRGGKTVAKQGVINCKDTGRRPAQGTSFYLEKTYLCVFTFNPDRF